MILITGSAGKTGKTITRALSRRGGLVRALVHNQAQEQNLLELGAREVRSGDMRDISFLADAMHGIDTIYYICPNVAPDETEIGSNLLKLARRNGVQRFGYHSVLHPQIEAMPHHWQKLRMEEQIFASGMDFTILQPCTYMQNILANWHTIIETGVFSVPYSTSARISIVDLEDIAEVAATMLLSGSHNNSVFELAGPQVLSQEDVAAILSKELHKPVVAKEIDRKTWMKNARISGLGEFQIEVLLKMFEYYDKYGLQGNPAIIDHLLNRSAKTFGEFVKQQVELTSRTTSGGNENHG